MDANSPGWRLGKRRPYLHYFVDGKSLCGRWTSHETPILNWYEDDRACIRCENIVLRRGLPDETELTFHSYMNRPNKSCTPDSGAA